MYQIQQITSDANQQQQLALPDGTLITLQLTYYDQQYGWFANISYGSSFVLNGFRIVTSPNILRQWKNLIPFGLCCVTQDDMEPTQLQDFSSGYATLYVLSSDDVQLYESYLQGQVS